MENEFNPEAPVCPVCQGAMWDNRVIKKNPKGPDFKCQNKECKFEMDKESGEWVASEYTTAVWLPKGNTFMGAVKAVKREQATSVEKARVAIKEAQEHKDDSIAWSNAKNNATLLVCNVNVYRTLTNQGDILAKVSELTNWFYSLEAPPFKN